MEALPSRIDLISIPVSMIPEVNSCKRKYSKEALLFFMLMVFSMILAAKVRKTANGRWGMSDFKVDAEQDVCRGLWKISIHFVISSRLQVGIDPGI